MLRAPKGPLLRSASAWRKRYCQQGQLCGIEIAPFAFFEPKRLQRQEADRRALQGAAMVTGCSQHALDLMVFALFQHDFEAVCIQRATTHGCQRGGFVMELHAGKQVRMTSSGVTGSCVVAM